MKYSLEKVIDAMEQRQQKEDWDIRHDAIEYLKDYKDKENRYHDEIKKTEDFRMMYIHAIADFEDNPPLTWDDLLKMKGKPVWLNMPEPKWIIILNAGVTQDGTKIFITENEFYDMKDYGIKWMPYRKERV